MHIHSWLVFHIYSKINGATYTVPSAIINEKWAQSNFEDRKAVNKSIAPSKIQQTCTVNTLHNYRPSNKIILCTMQKLSNLRNTAGLNSQKN